MVDAADPSRIPEAKVELESLLKMNELRHIPFVIFGNKVDKPGSLSEHDFRQHIGLPYHVTFGKNNEPNTNKIIRPIEVFMCSIKARVGYQDGFSWLSEFINA